jgi:hypothetical protein
VNVKLREAERGCRRSSLSRSGLPPLASDAACIDRLVADPESECCSGGAVGKAEVMNPIEWSGEEVPYG